MYCPNCGNKVPDDNKFCEECGTDLQKGSAQAAVSPQQPAPPVGQVPVIPSAPTTAPVPMAAANAPKKGSAGKIVAIVCIAVAVVAAIAIAVGMFACSQTPQAKLDTSKTGDLVDFVIGKWEGEASDEDVIYEFTDETAKLINDEKVVVWRGPYSLDGSSLIVYRDDSAKDGDPFSAVITKIDDDNMDLSYADGTVELTREGKGPRLSADEKTAKKLVGYWEGISEGGDPMQITFAPNGSAQVDYNGRENVDGGKYWVEGDKLFIESRVAQEKNPNGDHNYYEYTFHFEDNDNAIVMQSYDTQIPITFRKSSNLGQNIKSEPQTAPEAAPAPAADPYNEIAGLWGGTLQDGFPIEFRFKSDHSFSMAEDGEWFESGTYTISGNTLTLNGSFTHDTYTYSINGRSLTLEIPGAGASFYFTREG